MIRTSYKYLELIKLISFWLGLSALMVIMIVSVGLMFIQPVTARTKVPRYYPMYCHTNNGGLAKLCRDTYHNQSI